MGGSREDNLRLIKDLGNRIENCRRCPETLSCVQRPATGKGPLNPQIMIVSESENQNARGVDRISEIHHLRRTEFELDRIYHTYMIRCVPKACADRHKAFGYLGSKLLTDDEYCILTKQPCMGLPLPPDSYQILHCLAYLIEEVDILSPRYLLLLGERVAAYVLKAYGFFDSPCPGRSFHLGDMQILTAVNEELLSPEECFRLSAHLSA